MAPLVMTNAYLLLATVDLSDHCTKITFNIGSEEIDITAMGAVFKNRTTGLKDWSVNLTLQQDFAAGKVDATIAPIVFATPSTAAVEMRPVNAARSATNPGYTGTVAVTEYSPLDTSVGELAVVTFTWPGAGLLQRQTS